MIAPWIAVAFLPFLAMADIQFLDVMTTTVTSKLKRILAQIGSNTGRTVDGVNSEWWQHVGFISRPSKPVAGKASARAVAIRKGTIDAIIASEDDRGLELKGNLKEGETCVYAPGEDGKGQARALFKANGGINLYTRVGNKEDGAGMIVQLDAENDAIRITNGKGYGIIIDSNGVAITTGGSKAGLVIGADGKCSMIGTGPCQIDGSRIVLGAIALPGVNNVCTGPAGIAAIPSTKVFAATT